MLMFSCVHVTNCVSQLKCYNNNYNDTVHEEVMNNKHCYAIYNILLVYSDPACSQNLQNILKFNVLLDHRQSLVQI